MQKTKGNKATLKETITKNEEEIEIIKILSNLKTQKLQKEIKENITMMNKLGLNYKNLKLINKK